MLDQHADEALDRAELGGVDHHRLLAGAVRCLVLQGEPLGLVEVVLDRRHLPGPTDRVPGLHRDLRPVEGGATGVRDELEPAVSSALLEHGRGRGPVLVGADELVRLGVVARRQLEVVVVEAEVLQQPEDEGQQVLDLLGRLLLRAVGVRVVLREAADAGQAVDDPGLLEAVDGPELEQPQRQLAVGATARPVDQVVHRAVHGLEVVVAALHLHGREHRVRVVRQVPGRLEQALLGDVRGADVLEPLLDVALADVVLHLALEHAALGVEDRQAGADLVGEGEQVELHAEAPVVALLRLLEPVQVVLEVVLRRPGRAVDALQLLVGLVAAPVGRGRPHELEGRDVAGRRQVRPAAQVLPRTLVADEVVVDRQLGAADLDALAGVTSALEADELELELLLGQLGPGLVLGDDATREALALPDDVAHLLLDGREVLGRERPLGQEVVVEAVLDGRTDAEQRPGEQLLHGLGQHVRRRVAQHHQPVRRAERHRLDLVPGGDDVGQVAQLALDPGHSRVLDPGLAQQLAGGGPGRLSGDGQDGGGHSGGGHDSGLLER